MIVFYLALALFTFTSPPQNSWNGIVPLKSTRTDVEKILGKPMPDSKVEHIASYKTKNEMVTVLYSTGDCKIQANNGWNIPKGKVIRFSVTPINPPKFADYKFDESKFSSYLEDYVILTTYTNGKDGVGFTVNTSEGVIGQFSYFPTSKDYMHLLCKKTSPVKKAFRWKW